MLAAACSDSTSPERALAPPLFSFSVGGIALDQQNSAMGQPGRRFVKGFNPTNPQNGDAIVVSFFWIGSTYIIDSVTDHLVDANFTKVGNTYNLVEYVTAGGISMATFVATGVQNIPPANPDGTNVLAVEAILHDSVPDGGIWMSAWRGVEDVYAQALGAHLSGSGAGSAPTAAHPGTLTTTTSGALVYGVSMSRPPVGVDPPPGFTHIDPFDNIGDATLKADARFAVEANPTAVDPTWTWYYDQTNSGTWLATGLVLKAATSTATTGNLTATTSTTGSNLDPDGYTVTVDGTTSQPIATNGSVTFNDLPAGSHSIALSGAAANCTVTSANPQTVTVPPGGTATATFSVSCTATTGNLTVSTSTTGSGLDPDGYTVTLDGGSARAIGINASISYTNLTPGNHTAAISGVAANCTVSGGTSRTASVPSGGTATTTFSVSCTAPNSAPVVNAGPDATALTGLLYSFSPSFSDANNDGPWSYRIDWVDGSVSTFTRTTQVSFSVVHTYVIILPRSFTIRVTVTDAHGASGSDTKVVTVYLL